MRSDESGPSVWFDLRDDYGVDTVRFQRKQFPVPLAMYAASTRAKDNLCYEWVFCVELIVLHMVNATLL